MTPEVNLLPEDNLEERPGGKFLKWALSWGKKIVVVTELIVVLAFLSRFKLDSDVANNSEEIDRRKTIILASEEFEKEFRVVSEKVKKIEIAENIPTVVKIYDTANALIPSDVTLSEFSIKSQKVSLVGKGEDSEVSKMVAAFKSSPNFSSDVVLDTVTKRGDESTVNFSMTATYVKRK